MSQGIKVSIGEKVDLVDWLITGKGSQAAWARKHNRAPETVSRLFDDPEFKELWASAERAQEQRRAFVIEKAYQIVADTDHMNWGRAADFLAKAFGWYKPTQVDVKVDRVAYVEPGSLRELSRELHPELRPN